MAEVTIYSTPTCGYCKMAKDFMDENDVKYTEIDVHENPEEGPKMVEKSGQMGVPVIIVTEGAKEEVLVGFDQEELEKHLGINQ